MKFLILKIALVFSVLFLNISSSDAQSEECMHIVFTSSATIRSNMRTSNLPAELASQIVYRSARETATDFCQLLAGTNDNLVSETFKAVLSLNTNTARHADDADKPLNARDYVQIDGPVCNTNGEVVARNAAEFWSNSHRANMNFDENGASRGKSAAWTGSDTSGVYNASSCGGRPTCNCYNWTSTKDTSHGGNTGRGCSRDFRWASGAWRDASADASGCPLSNGIHNSPCGALHNLYCLGRSNYMRAMLPEKHGPR